MANIFIRILRGLSLPRLRTIYYGLRFGKGSLRGLIYRPVCFTAKHISWGKGLVVYKNCRVEGVSQYGGKTYVPLIELGENVSFQQNCHITCAQHLYIGNNTALANNVTVTDINHCYEDVTTTPKSQPIEVSPVIIGEDCTIYNNAVICPGTNLGKHCVVGANSVVNGIFPDFSIIAGAPARIVKRYDVIEKRWRPTNPDGSFKIKE